MKYFKVLSKFHFVKSITKPSLTLIFSWINSELFSYVSEIFYHVAPTYVSALPSYIVWPDALVLWLSVHSETLSVSLWSSKHDILHSLWFISLSLFSNVNLFPIYGSFTHSAENSHCSIMNEKCLWKSPFWFWAPFLLIIMPGACISLLLPLFHFSYTVNYHILSITCPKHPNLFSHLPQGRPGNFLSEQLGLLHFHTGTRVILLKHIFDYGKLWIKIFQWICHDKKFKFLSLVN